MECESMGVYLDHSILMLMASRPYQRMYVPRELSPVLEYARGDTWVR